MPKDVKDMETELAMMKQQMRELRAARATVMSDDDMPGLIRYLKEERERTNRILESIAKRISLLERHLEETDAAAAASDMNSEKLGRALLSDVDAKIVNFVQIKDMVCADDVCKHMGYNGRNAASARLNKLYNQGLLERFQLGHTVYYKFDAGKATNTLIVSPPQ